MISFWELWLIVAKFGLRLKPFYNRIIKMRIVLDCLLRLAFQDLRHHCAATSIWYCSRSSTCWQFQSVIDFERGSLLRPISFSLSCIRKWIHRSGWVHEFLFKQPNRMTNQLVFETMMSFWLSLRAYTLQKISTLFCVWSQNSACWLIHLFVSVLES